MMIAFGSGICTAQFVMMISRFVSTSGVSGNSSSTSTGSSVHNIHD